MHSIVYILAALIVSFSLSPVAFAKDIEARPSELVGTVKEGQASWYAIVSIDGRKKLYTKGDIFYSEFDITECFRIEDIEEDALILKKVDSGEVFTIESGERIPVEGADIIFEKTVESDFLEYRYKGPEKGSEKNSKADAEDFIVSDLGRGKIVLEKDYDRSALMAVLSEEEKEIFMSEQLEPGESETIKADLFENIKIAKAGNDVWSVDRDSARKALSNVGHTLTSVIKRVEPRFRFGEGPSLKFKCELGDVVLNRQGFLVQNLAVAKIAERTGIRQGDLIKSINGRPVNSLYGIFKTYMSIKSDKNIKVVNVDIVRDGNTRTLTYRVE